MTEQIEFNKPPLIQRISFITVLVIIAAIFTSTAVIKFTNIEQIVAHFSTWDLLKWKEVIGAMELVGVILFLLPKTNLVGSLLLSSIMFGAIYTHFTHSEPIFFNVAIVIVIWINYFFVKPKK